MLQQGLLVLDLDDQVRGDRVGQHARIGDLGDRVQAFRRDLLVQLDIVLELLGDGADQRLGIRAFRRRIIEQVGLGLVIVVLGGETLDTGARLAFDQHLDRAIGQLQQLQDIGQHADLIDGVGVGIIVRGILLGGQQDLLVAPHHLVQRLNRLLAADEQRHDHVGENHDIAQRQDGNGNQI